MSKKLDKTIPITLLIRELDRLADETLQDSTAAIAILPDDTDDLLKEKAQAAVSLRNNLSLAVTEPHAFANLCLVANGVFPSVDYLAQASVQYIDYFLWELRQTYPDLIIHPNVVNYIKACMETEDFVIPSDNIHFLNEYFVGKYKDDAKNIFEMYDNYAKDDNFVKTLKASDKFTQFHMSKLLTVDSYVLKMKDIYNQYKKGLVTDG